MSDINSMEEREGAPNFFSTSLIAVGMAAALIALQYWPVDRTDSPTVSVAQALQTGGDLSGKLEATAAGPDRSYLPSQFISEIERAEFSELPPQF